MSKVAIIKLEKKQVFNPNALTFDVSMWILLTFWICIWLNKPLNITICSFSSFISWSFSNMLTSVSCDGYLEKQKWKCQGNSGEVRSSVRSQWELNFTTFQNIYLPWFFLLQRICFFLKFCNLLIFPNHGRL